MQAPTPPPAELSRSEVARIAVLLVASSFTVMAGATIAPALPQMKAAFQSVAHAQLLTELALTLPGLFIALCAGPAGWVIDRFGRLKLLYAGLLLYAASGASGLFVESLPMLLIGRAFLGVAVAAIMTVTVTLIADYFTGDRRRRTLGLQSASMAFGGIFFLTGGGALADVHWRAPFAVYLAALPVIPFAVWVLFEPQLDEARARVRRRARDVIEAPIRKEIAILYATAFCGTIIFYNTPLQLPFFLKFDLNIADNLRSGLALSSMTLASAIVASRYAWIRARLSSRAIFALMFGGLGLGMALVATASTYWEVIAAMLVGGMGVGVFMPHMSVELVNRSPEEFRGRVVGGMTMAVFAGQFVSPFPAQLIKLGGNIRWVFVGCAVAAIFMALAHVLRRAR